LLIARSVAEIDTAELLLLNSAAAADMGAPSDHQVARAQRDYAVAAELALAAVNRLFSAAGSEADPAADVLRRHWLDINTAAAHPALQFRRTGLDCAAVLLSDTTDSERPQPQTHLVQRGPMPNSKDQAVIDEFRAKGGQVGGIFAGVPIALLHHRGHRTGAHYTTPVVYLPAGPDEIYLFASNGGAPTNPRWYTNLIAAQTAEIEIGTDRYSVQVAEIHGPERDRLYAEQSARYPHFAAYEREAQTVGRTIPVLRLQSAEVNEHSDRGAQSSAPGVLPSWAGTA
jgi:deazaflavin-dependent oxidoreductase (nitroreductase family)